MQRTVTAMTNEEALECFESDCETCQFKGHDCVSCRTKCAISALLAQGSSENPNNWISVKDRLPDESYPVLCVTSAGGMMIARYGHKYGSWHVSGSIDITHWMPLPEPSEVKK